MSAPRQTFESESLRLRHKPREETIKRLFLSYDSTTPPAIFDKPAIASRQVQGKNVDRSDTGMVSSKKSKMTNGLRCHSGIALGLISVRHRAPCAFAESSATTLGCDATNS